MRHKKTPKRVIPTDPKYDSVLVQRFINNVMKDGKKFIAQKLVYDSLDIIKKEAKEKPLSIFEKAIENASPLLEVKSRRVGGATYQVPREVKGDRRSTLAIRWILAAARSKKGKPMANKLAEELLAAYKNEGTAIKKKEDTRKMAEANRAFAHFAW
jgi:small subunit ribosomal protein S7